MEETMPPTSNKPKGKRTAVLPDQVWCDLEKIAAHYGESQSEALRRVVSAGLEIEMPKVQAKEDAEQLRRQRDLELENKELINARLRAKEAGALEVLNDWESGQFEGDKEARAAAIEMIREWLSRG
jgi:hypothetical protein